jgi:hypothetical protein
VIPKAAAPPPSPNPTCTHTLDSTATQSVTVSSGTWCINRSAVQGGITVNPGAGVVVTNSSVSGPISAQGATAFRLCSDRVGGDVSATGGTGFVLVGDPGDDSCGGNTLQQSASFDGNSAGLDLVGNSVAGSVTVTGTSGTGPQPGDTNPAISGNSIGGSLSCSGNNPPPSNEGHPNAVQGSRDGQCTGSF